MFISLLFAACLLLVLAYLVFHATDMGFTAVEAADSTQPGRGLIFDVNQSYFRAFSLAAAIMLVVTWLISLIRRETDKYFTDV